MTRSENLTVMFTDIVGFTARTSQQSREENAAMLREHDRLLLPIVANFRGRKIKSIGDALLVVFRSPTDAARCGMALQDAVWEHNQSRSGDTPLRIRVAMMLGDVRLDGGDVFGEPVNIAARIEGMTPPDEVYLAQAVYLAMNKAEVPAEFVQTAELKGIPEPVDVYRVPPTLQDSNAGEPTPPFGGMHRQRALSGADSMQLGFLAARWGVGAGFSQGMRWIREAPVALRAVVALLLVSPLLAWGAGALQPEAKEPKPPAKSSLLAELKEDVDSERWEVVSLRAEQALSEDPENAEARFLLGHVACANKERESCIERYATALDRDPALSGDSTFVKNTVDALGWLPEPTQRLLSEHASEAAVTALVERAESAGYWGRTRAYAVLATLGEEDKVNAVSLELHNLDDAPSCPKRKAAVKRLQALGDRRALPALRKASRQSTIFHSNRCLAGAARAAAKHIDNGASQ